MKFFLILSWAVALSLATPEIHRHTVDDSDILLRRRHAVEDNDSLLKRSHHNHQSPSSSARHHGCSVMAFLRSAPHYISESLSRMETVGANSGLLPIFWFTGDKESKTTKHHHKHKQQDSSVSFEDDLNVAWVKLDDEQIKAILESEGATVGIVTEPPSPTARFFHAIMVWAHILSFSLLIFFTAIYATAFVLRKRLPNSPETQDLKDQKEPLLEEV